MFGPDEAAAAAQPAALLDRVFTGHPVKLAVFEGPLDLLLYLIERDEIDIFDIPIEHITNEYLQYLAQLETLNIDVCGEFLVMAAQLLEIKSRMLLPQPERPPEEQEEAGDPRAEELRARADLQQYVFSRGLFLTGEEPSPDQRPHLMLGEVSAFDLWAAFQDVLSRVKEPAAGAVVRPRFTVAQKMAAIASRLRWATEGIRFEQLFDQEATRAEVIVAFLALLELIRLRRVRVAQQGLLGEIRVYPMEMPTAADG